LDSSETIGIILLMGPLVLAVGGIFYAAITDAYKGSRPLANLSLRSRRKAKNDTERERNRKDSKVRLYIKEQKKRIR
jgi:hypothetical protein